MVFDRDNITHIDGEPINDKKIADLVRGCMDVLEDVGLKSGIGIVSTAHYLCRYLHEQHEAGQPEDTVLTIEVDGFHYKDSGDLGNFEVTVRKIVKNDIQPS